MTNDAMWRTLRCHCVISRSAKKLAIGPLVGKAEALTPARASPRERPLRVKLAWQTNLLPGFRAARLIFFRKLSG